MSEQQPTRRGDWMTELLDAQHQKIQQAATKYLTAERAIRLLLALRLKTPQLAECSPESILGCLVDAVKMGVEPGREAHFIPRKEMLRNPETGRREHTGRYVCTLIVDYKGLLTIALRSANILKIDARVVYKGDVFKHVLGDEERIVHVPNYEAQRTLDQITHCYAIAKLANGERVRDVLTARDIQAIRTMSENGDGAVWTDAYTATEMVRKTAVRRLFKYLPFPPDLKDCISIADRHEFNFDEERENVEVVPHRQLTQGDPGVVFTPPAAGEPVEVGAKPAPATSRVAAAAARQAPAQPAQQPQQSRPQQPGQAFRAQQAPSGASRRAAAPEQRGTLADDIDAALGDPPQADAEPMFVPEERDIPF